MHVETACMHVQISLFLQLDYADRSPLLNFVALIDNSYIPVETTEFACPSMYMCTSRLAGMQLTKIVAGIAKGEYIQL